MAQYISVDEIGEDANVSRRTDANFAVVNKALMTIPDWKKDYPWLATVDEYGMTVYNYLQLPYFLQELRVLISKIDNQEAIKEAEKTIEFIGDIEVHKYIRFMGD